MSNLCKYKDIFGKPGEGAHSYRIFNVAIIDVVFTIIFAVILAKVFKWDIFRTIIGLFIIGIIMHRIFCVRTTVDKLIFN
jgi:hypothetical protein